MDFTRSHASLLVQSMSNYQRDSGLDLAHIWSEQSIIPKLGRSVGMVVDIDTDGEIHQWDTPKPFTWDTTIDCFTYWPRDYESGYLLRVTTNNPDGESVDWLACYEYAIDHIQVEWFNHPKPFFEQAWVEALRWFPDWLLERIEARSPGSQSL